MQGPLAVKKFPLHDLAVNLLIFQGFFFLQIGEFQFDQTSETQLANRHAKNIVHTWNYEAV